jgi:Spy/CpxP family protein refolding chaperone
MKRALASFLIVVCLLGSAAAARATTSPDADADKRAQVEARMKQLRADILRKQVGLTPDKARVVEAVLEQHALERKKLVRTLHSERQALERLLEADSNEEAAYARTLRTLRSTRDQLQALRRRELDQLDKLMTAKQQAKLLSSLRRVQRKLHGALKAYREEN